MTKIINGGYGSSVIFDGMNILTSSFAITARPNVITSSASYGGKLTGVDSESIKTPFYIDYDEFTISLAFTPTLEHLIKICDWIAHRNQPKNLSCFMSNDGSITVDNCMFENISITVDMDSLVTVNLSMWGTCNNLTGGFGGVVSELGNGTLNDFDLDWTDKNKFTRRHVIPYWATKVNVDNILSSIMGWTIDFSQELVKKHYCQGLVATAAPYPYQVFCGALNATMNIDFTLSSDVVKYTDCFKKGTASGSGCTVHIIDQLFRFDKMVLTGFDPTVTESNTPFGITCNFDIYKISQIG